MQGKIAIYLDKPRSVKIVGPELLVGDDGRHQLVPHLLETVVPLTGCHRLGRALVEVEFKDVLRRRLLPEGPLILHGEGNSCHAFVFGRVSAARL